jgi:hypothetical protein
MNQKIKCTWTQFAFLMYVSDVMAYDYKDLKPKIDIFEDRSKIVMGLVVQDFITKNVNRFHEPIQTVNQLHSVEKELNCTISESLSIHALLAMHFNMHQNNLDEGFIPLHFYLYEQTGQLIKEYVNE